MIINRIYENPNLISLVSFLVGLRTYQHPWMTVVMVTVIFSVFVPLIFFVFWVPIRNFSYLYSEFYTERNISVVSIWKAKPILSFSTYPSDTACVCGRKKHFLCFTFLKMFGLPLLVLQLAQFSSLCIST